MTVGDEYAAQLTLTDDSVAMMPTMRRAFDYVIDLAGVDYCIEQKDGVHTLTFRDRLLDAANNHLEPAHRVAGVPEPSAWAMMLIGFLGLGAMVRLGRKSLAKLA